MKRKRKHRRSRKNSWSGNRSGHSRAARKGVWRAKRRGRKTRRNAGSLSISAATRSATRGFNASVLKRGGAVVYGNVSTTWVAEKLMQAIPQLRSHKALEVLTVLGTAVVNSIATQKFAPKMVARHANDIFIGGLLAGTTRALKALMPGTFSTCGLSEDLSDFGPGMHGQGWTIGPAQTAPGRTFNLGEYYAGTVGHPDLGNFTHLRTPLVNMGDFGDQANIGQTGQQRLTHLINAGHVHPHMRGLDAMDELASEIEMSM